ncbi:MAG: C-terminal binding protein [Eubacteriales bacterium]|nr:C-terminal binding protein [Eubacteriales bacterium]
MRAVVVDKDYGSVTAEELEQVRKAYEAAGIDLELRHFSTEEEIIEGCQGVAAILGTGNPPITRKVVEALPDLKFIQRFGAGVNSIDMGAAAEMGKVVLNLPGFCAKELADLATAMIMGLIRNTVYYDREIRKGKWPKCQYLLPGDVRGMTLGLYGFGEAGRCLFDIFHRGFGTRVISCDPYVSDSIKMQYPEVAFVSFEELLKQSDIISIHVVLTPETTHAFDKNAFQKMKNTSMIINTSRGSVIDQKDLIWALENGEILYAGLDTMEQEPILEDDPLLKLDNVILSPHSGSYGAGAKKTQIQMVCSLIPQAIREGKISSRCVANKEVLKQKIGYEFI